MPDPLDLGALPYTFALRAASEGMSANAFLAALREQGIGIRRSVGLTLYGQARRTVAEYGAQLFTPQAAVPDTGTFGSTLTQGATGVLQHVQLVYREQVTGRQIIRHYSVKGETPITPQEAVDQAADAYADAADRYRQTLIGAIYTGGTKLVPFAEVA